MIRIISTFILYYEKVISKLETFEFTGNVSATLILVIWIMFVLKLGQAGTEGRKTL